MGLPDISSAFPVCGSVDSSLRTHSRHAPDTPQVDTVRSGMKQPFENFSQKSGRDRGATADHISVERRRFIKKKELAARLSISPRTVDDLVAKRVIPYIAISPRLHLFDPDAVQAALSKRFEVRAKGVLL